MNIYSSNIGIERKKERRAIPKERPRRESTPPPVRKDPVKKPERVKEPAGV